MQTNHQVALLPFSIANDFKFQKLLSYNSLQKLIVLLGEIKGETAIIVMEKTQFPTESNQVIENWMSLIENPNGLNLQQVVINDKYHMANLSVAHSDQFNLIKTSM